MEIHAQTNEKNPEWNWVEYQYLRGKGPTERKGSTDLPKGAEGVPRERKISRRKEEVSSRVKFLTKEH